jgi:hypothetical protein
MVMHSCNSSTRRLRQEDYEFKAIWAYTARPCLEKHKITKKTKTHNDATSKRYYLLHNKCCARHHSNFFTCLILAGGYYNDPREHCVHLSTMWLQDLWGYSRE